MLLWLGVSWLAVFHRGYFGKCKFHIALDGIERAGERFLARDEDVIVPGEGVKWANFACGFAQAAFDAVALYGVAHFFGDGEAEARLWACGMTFGAKAHLQYERAGGKALGVVGG